MAYNRVVADLAGRTVGELLAAVGEVLDVVERARGGLAVAAGTSSASTSTAAGSRSPRPTGSVDESDPLARLDVSVLQERVLAPLLGIGDPRTDARIAFVGGIRGDAEIERLVDAGRAAVGLRAVPDVDGRARRRSPTPDTVMPPKSTWFEPKLASGLVVHPLSG